MDYKKIGRYFVLAVLFFLPVTFLLLLYPATHNYEPLEIVNQSVQDLDGFTSDTGEKIVLKDYITVLGFLGSQPMDHVTVASNLKELVYDKFKGFKKFQIVIVMPNGTQEAAEKLKKEINAYEDMRFWHVVFNDSDAIKNAYASMKSDSDLDANLATNHVFIIDKDLNQRGRLDDRTDNEKAKKRPVYGLNDYDCIQVAEIKNKMSDDIRILLTEYRQKRKGEFNSEIRRANDLKGVKDE